VRDADDRLDASLRLLHDEREHALALRVRKTIRLAEHAEREHAGDACADAVVDEGTKALLVQRLVGRKRRREDAVDSRRERYSRVSA
jgi:hypothetical protein